MICCLLLWVLAGCQNYPENPPVEKDGNRYGVTRGAFRHRWWNYYERGISFAEGGFLEKALVDLREAARQMERDTRMARTYGMHFIDYFPHREIGVILYEMGRYEEAKTALTRSIEDFPTAKARFYLDKVRGAILRETRYESGRPEIDLSPDEEMVLTRDDPVILRGTVTDPAFVSAVTVMGAPLLMEGARREFRFMRELKLPQGRHAVRVTAENLLGGMREREIIVMIDREGPLVIIDEVASGMDGRFTVNGSVYDPSSVAELRVNGESMAAGEVESFFSYRSGHDASVEIRCADALGNGTTALIDFSGIESPTAGRPGSVASRRYPLFAGLETDRWTAVAPMASAEALPPRVQLRDLDDHQVVYTEKIYIAGHVWDPDKVAELRIDGVPILRRPGERIYFNHPVELREGENEIRIVAVDEKGERSETRIEMVRKVPVALQLSERMRLALFPFDEKGDISAASRAFSDQMLNALLERRRFRVLERERLDLVLREQQLSAAKLTDPDTALRVGRLAAAHSVMVGSIIESRKGVEIIGRMVDTETGEVLASRDVYDEAKSLPAMKGLADALALKFHNDFPLLTGEVMIRKDDVIFSDMGKDEIALHRRLIIFREEPVRHPETGKVLGADNRIVGHARVDQVLPEMSRAALLEPAEADVRILDKVITQ